MSFKPTQRLNRLLYIALLLTFIQYIPAARAELVIIVHPSNPIERITMPQIADIYLKKKFSFPQGRSVEPIDQEANNPIRSMFYATILGRTEAQIRAYWSKRIYAGKRYPPDTLSSDQQVREYIAEHRDAIGYIDDSSVDDSVRVVSVIK